MNQAGVLKMGVDFSTIAKGDDSGVRTARNVVVSSQHAWKDLWAVHTSDVSPPAPVPPVNFDAEFVVAVFGGQKPASGYAIEIVRMRTRPATLGRSPVLEVGFREEGPSAFEEDVITGPYHIVRVRSRVENFDRVAFVAF